jgi:hypothetical protein
MKKTNQPENLCEQCQAEQRDANLLIFFIGLFTGCISTGIIAWIIYGITRP